MDILDFHKIARFQGELARAKTVLSERKVSVDTLKEEKLFAVEISRSGGEGVLRKSSVIEKWQKQYKTVPPAKGGYSDIRLWPCYMVFTGLILFLLPYTGAYVIITFVVLPAFLIAHKVAGIQNSNPEGVKQYEARIYNVYRELHIKSYMRENGLNRPRVMARSVPQAAEAKQSKQLKSIGNIKLSPQFTR